MSNNIKKNQRYRILAQYPDARLRVEDTVTKNQFVLPAHQIANDADMILNFNGQDGCTIGFIAASFVETVIKLPHAQKEKKPH